MRWDLQEEDWTIEEVSKSPYVVRVECVRGWFRLTEIGPDRIAYDVFPIKGRSIYGEAPRSFGSVMSNPIAFFDAVEMESAL